MMYGLFALWHSVTKRGEYFVGFLFSGGVYLFLVGIFMLGGVLCFVGTLFVSCFKLLIDLYL